MRTPAGFFFVSQKVNQVEFSKPPLDIPAQIGLLKSRGMTFADEDRASRVLSHVNYYRLRAYWLPFEKTGQTQTAANNHSFQDGTHFDDVYSLYVFDRRLVLRANDINELAKTTISSGMLYIGNDPIKQIIPEMLKTQSDRAKFGLFLILVATSI